MTDRRHRGLGRGLDALIPAAPAQPDAAAAEGDVSPRQREVDIDLIAPNPEQPRTRFEPEALRELAASIGEHGIIQPLVVTRNASGGFQLVAGERRLQAARLAGLARVPVVLREAEDSELLELALIENVQRADLNALEEAQAYRRLVDEHGLAQSEVARRLGKSRSAIANALRLLALEPEIRQSLASGEISEGHARALLGAPEGPIRVEAWRHALERGLNVRQVEALARKLARETAAPPGSGPPPSPPRDSAFADLAARLRRRLGTRVGVSRKGEGATITIDCYSREELDAVIANILGEGP